MIIKLLFNFLVFPGFIFILLAGMLASWIDRKITARVQWRVGPVLLQPFYDIRKLLFKEIITPAQGNIVVFVFAPVLALTAIIILSNILVLSWLNPAGSFVGDFIVFLYIFTIPALSLILGASASANPFASLGASREIKAVMSYELPFIFSILVPVIKSKSLSFGDIITSQHAGMPFVLSISGFIAFAVALVCLQAKVGLVPFDFSEAETELAAGTLIEYSGPLLGIWKVCKMGLMVVAPLFLIVAFWPGSSVLGVAVKYLFILILMVLIRNTNPRIRIDQSVKFFWYYLTPVSLLSCFLAVLGL
jgi:NADH-quinone oxidoreductase subunit H